MRLERHLTLCCFLTLIGCGTLVPDASLDRRSGILRYRIENTGGDSFVMHARARLPPEDLSGWRTCLVELERVAHEEARRRGFVPIVEAIGQGGGFLGVNECDTIGTVRPGRSLTVGG